MVFRERQDKKRADQSQSKGRNKRGGGGGGDARAAGGKPGGGNRPKAGKGGQVWTKVRSQKPRRNKARKPAAES